MAKRKGGRKGEIISRLYVTARGNNRRERI
jgi:hypothetical protein